MHITPCRPFTGFLTRKAKAGRHGVGCSCSEKLPLSYVFLREKDSAIDSAQNRFGFADT